MNSAIEYVTVPFMGCDVLAVALDGIPVKNHLPAPLAAALKTANQWRDLGFSPKPGAKKFNLHPNCMAKRTYTYFVQTDFKRCRYVFAPSCVNSASASSE